MLLGNKILYGIAIVCWMMIIFYFSARDSYESTLDSRGLIRSTVNVCVTFANKLGIIKEMPSESELNAIVKKLDNPVRKLAHGTVYFVLALLILLALGTNSENFVRNAVIAVGICFLYAATDEYHQTFVSRQIRRVEGLLY